jgi:hypothetical protein
MENEEKLFAELGRLYEDKLTGMDILAKSFQNVLAGKEIHEIEKQRGMFSGEKPEITGIIRSEETQKIKQSKMLTTAMAENAAQLENSFDKTREKLNPNLALITVAKAVGVDVDAEVFVGLEGLDSRTMAILANRKTQQTKGGK